MTDDPVVLGEKRVLAAALAFSLVATAVWVAGVTALLGVGAGPLGGSPDTVSDGGVERAASASNESVANVDPTLSGFTDRARTLGFEYAYTRTGEAGMRDLVTNAGVYVSDYDNDGQPDILAVGGERPVLFENRGGRFVPSTVLPALDSSVNAALFLDYDNDGWDDLLVLRANRSALLLENRNGSFRAVDGGFDERLENPTGAAAADFDRDGCLDVFVFQNGNWDARTPIGLERSSARFISDDNGNSNYLYEGDCSGFRRVTDAGIRGTTWSLAGSFVDMTGDGYPDIHVGNDYNADFLYVNRGNGTFERTLLPSSDRNAMSSTAFDVNDDARLDVFVSNVYFDDELEGASPTLPVRGGGNNLFVNRGNGSFEDRAAQYGVREGGWAWAAVAADFNNDGYRSLMHTITPMGGEIALQQQLDRSRTEIYRAFPYLAYPMFYQRTASDSFEAIHPPEVGFERGSGRGVAALDANADGAPDLAVTETRTATGSGNYSLYLNNGSSNAWVGVRVQPGKRLPALGAQVSVRTEEGRETRIVRSRTGYLSQSTRRVHVGLGDADSVRSIRVRWPDGTEITVSNPPVNETVVVSPDDE
ncbi:CRTAC1 family protein [Halosimplex sp. J119]